VKPPLSTPPGMADEAWPTSDILVVGNWKMNGSINALKEIQAIEANLARFGKVDVTLCLPATLIEAAAKLAHRCGIGAQDVHWASKGPYTGSLSAEMMVRAGATLTLVGHCERRGRLNETSHDVKLKAEAALLAGLKVIVCVGEDMHTRRSGTAVGAVVEQLRSSLPVSLKRRVAIAYEPIWAVGNGITPTGAEVAEMHRAMRDVLLEMYGKQGGSIPLLYGGSVTSTNAAELFETPEVNGVLVGSASLRASDLLPIISTASSCWISQNNPFEDIGALSGYVRDRRLAPIR